MKKIRKTIKEKTAPEKPGQKEGYTPEPQAEENLDREELLRAIESPEIMGNIEGGSIKYKELSIKKEEEPVLGIAEQKDERCF